MSDSTPVCVSGLLSVLTRRPVRREAGGILREMKMWSQGSFLALMLSLLTAAPGDAYQPPRPGRGRPDDAIARLEREVAQLRREVRLLQRRMNQRPGYGMMHNSFTGPMRRGMRGVAPGGPRGRFANRPFADRGFGAKFGGPVQPQHRKLSAGQAGVSHEGKKKHAVKRPGKGKPGTAAKKGKVHARPGDRSRPDDRRGPPPSRPHHVVRT